MADPIYGTPRFNLGDRVRIRHGYGWKGRIVEWRGPLAPGGVQVYRVRIQTKPTEEFVEVREDQLVLLPSKHNPFYPNGVPPGAAEPPA
jgi:hypothetical protein